MNRKIKLSPRFMWDKEKEEEFKEHRKKAIKTWNYETKSASYTMNGVGPLMQRTTKGIATGKKREMLIRRHMDGEWLTVAEIRYLMLTSLSLEQFINKEFYQDCVDVLDPGFLEKVKISQKYLNNQKIQQSSLK